jgi:DnaK suppressor protein
MPTKSKTGKTKATSRQPDHAQKKTAPAKKEARRRSSDRFLTPPPVEVEKDVIAGKGSKHLSAEAKRSLREQLLSLRERITGQINFLATDNLNRTQKDTEVDFRSEEQGTDNFDRDFALNRVSLEQDIVFEIDEAMNRLKIGTYGLCESCTGPIEKARLGALPYSRMCIACQSKTEAGRKRFRSFESAALFPNIEKTVAEQAAEEE